MVGTKTDEFNPRRSHPWERGSMICTDSKTEVTGRLGGPHPPQGPPSSGTAFDLSYLAASGSAGGGPRAGESRSSTTSASNAVIWLRRSPRSRYSSTRRKRAL